MHPILIRRLESQASLSDPEREALLRLGGPPRAVGARDDIVRRGEKQGTIGLILEGFAYRYQDLPDGRRQITGCLIPGDLCDPRTLFLNTPDHSVATAVPCLLAPVAPAALRGLMDAHPGIASAVWRLMLVEEAIVREWLVCIGQRTAHERMAHFFCELFFRLRAVGLISGASCELPLTQTELGDLLGLSAVHVNRVLQDLRREELVALTGKRLVLRNMAALQHVAMFDPAYLRLRENAQEQVPAWRHACPWACSPLATGTPDAAPVTGIISVRRLRRPRRAAQDSGEVQGEPGRVGGPSSGRRSAVAMAGRLLRPA